MRSLLRVSFNLFALLVVGGCSSTDPAPAAPEDAAAPGTPEAAPSADGPSVEAEAAVPTCVPEGTVGNEKGIGSFCKSSADCVSEAGARLCTADFGLSPTFCTTICTVDTDCGSGMYCAHTAMGTGCTPLACVAPDAG